MTTRGPGLLPGMEEGGEDGQSLQGKPLCASVEGFSLHAAQAVGAEDREALERLLRYGLRAPFSQERLSVREDGKVVYRLRRPWPNERGATHLLLDPHDFLRRLAALVSFPYAHQVRYHGVFANRSRMRRLLPPAPRREETNLEAVEARAPASPTLPLAMPALPMGAAPQTTKEMPSPPRRRVPWAQLLRRVLHVEALSCSKCSTSLKAVPMIVLAFLTDPGVVERILRHLGLPVHAPALAPARSLPWLSSLDPLPPASRNADLGDGAVEEPGACEPAEEGYGRARAAPSLGIRPPP